MNGWIILIGIPVLGLCVFMHELGHFLAAKWTGIHVEEFGLGFPPRLLQLSCHVQPSQRQPAQTMGHHPATIAYSLGLLPLGGFVRLRGELRSHHKT